MPETLLRQTAKGENMSKPVSKNIENKTRLIRELQSLLDPYGIRNESIVDAVEKSLQEIKRDGSSKHPWLFPMVFWKIFDSKGFLPIDHKTPAGNVIPFDVLAAAYAMWREARLQADAFGLDELDADHALINVVHGLADQRAKGAKGAKGATGKYTTIMNLPRYMFAAYIHQLRRIAKKIGIVRGREYRQFRQILWDSQDGTFVEAMDNAVLYGEVMNDLSEKEEYAVRLRCIAG